MATVEVASATTALPVEEKYEEPNKPCEVTKEEEVVAVEQPEPEVVADEPIKEAATIIAAPEEVLSREAETKEPAKVTPEERVDEKKEDDAKPIVEEMKDENDACDTPKAEVEPEAEAETKAEPVAEATKEENAAEEVKPVEAEEKTETESTK